MCERIEQILLNTAESADSVLSVSVEQIEFHFRSSFEKEFCCVSLSCFLIEFKNEVSVGGVDVTARATWFEVDKCSYSTFARIFHNFILFRNWFRCNSTALCEIMSTESPSTRSICLRKKNFNRRVGNVSDYLFSESI